MIAQDIPTRGWLLPKWGTANRDHHRATTYAYIKREKVSTVRNADGKRYSARKIVAAVNNFNNERG